MHRVAVAARGGADNGGLRRVFGIWFYYLREQDVDHVHADSACTDGNEDIVFNATGQQYRQTTSFTYTTKSTVSTEKCQNV